MKYYKHYQKYCQLRRCFVCIIKVDLDFNYDIIIDIMYVKRKLVIYLIKKIT